MKKIILIILFLAGLSHYVFSETDVFKLNQDADILILEGDYFSAIEKYKTVLEINPNYINSVKGLAEAYFFLGEYEEAYRQIKNARRYDMQNIDLLGLEGRIALGMGNLEEAGKIFRFIKDKEPYNINAYFGFAEIALISGNYSESFSNYHNILTISPANRKALLSLVLLSSYQENYIDAEKYLTQAMRFYSDDYFARYIAAKHYLKAGNFRQAENNISISTRLNPGFPDSALLYAKVLLETEKYSLVTEILEPFYKNRDNSLIPYTLGKAYEKNGETDNALKLYADAFRLNPDNEIARYSLENLIRSTKGFTDPIRARYADYHFRMGKGLEERNYIQKAINSFRRGLIIDPYSVIGRLHYANIFFKLGYNAKYLSELLTLPELERKKQQISDSIEIIGSIIENNVSSRWGIDQFLIPKNAYKINIFYIDTMSMIHPLGEETVTEVFINILNHNDNMRITNTERKINSYAQAFSRSRYSVEPCDYFIIIKYSESERVFNINASLYSSYTGALIREYNISKTGNLRIWEALSKLSDDLQADTGTIGEIIKLEFEKGIINLGKMERIKDRDSFIIIRKNGIKPDRNRLNYIFDNKDILGTFTVTRVDESISEGIIKNKDLFSLVNYGDIVIPESALNDKRADTGTGLSDYTLYNLILEIK